TMAQKGGSATDLMAKPDETHYAALLSPDQETFIPEAGLSPPAAMPPGYPNVLGYEILGALGRGGMGVVYKARHKGLGRLVALKRILSETIRPSHIARFRLAAETVAAIQHPNIVQTYDIGAEDAKPYCGLQSL